MGMNQMTEPMAETEVSKRHSFRQSSDHDDNKRPSISQATKERPGLRTQSSFRGGLDKIQAFAAGRPGMRKESSFRLDKIQGLISQANQAMTALSDHAITASGLGKSQINLDGKAHDSFLNQSGHTASTMSSFDSSEGLTIDERVAAACSSSAEARRRAAEGLDSDVFRSTFNAPKPYTSTSNHRPAASARLSASILTAPMLSSPQTRKTGVDASHKNTSHITDTASSRLSRSSIHRRRSLNLPVSKSMEVQAALRRANTSSVSYRRSLSRSKTPDVEGKESSLKEALKRTEEKYETRSSSTHNRRQPLVRNKTYDERYSSSRPHSTSMHRRSSLRDLKSIHERTSLQQALLHEDSKHRRAKSIHERTSLQQALLHEDSRHKRATGSSSHGRRSTLTRRRSSRTCLYDLDADDAAAAERSQKDVKRRASDVRRNRDEPKLRRANTTTESSRPSKRNKSTNMKRSKSIGSPQQVLKDMPKQMDDMPEKKSRSSRPQKRRSSTEVVKTSDKVANGADHASKHTTRRSVSKTTKDDGRSSESQSDTNKKTREQRRSSTITTSGGGRRRSSARRCKADAKTVGTKLAALEKSFSNLESPKSTPNTPAA